MKPESRWLQRAKFWFACRQRLRPGPQPGKRAKGPVKIGPFCCHALDLLLTNNDK